MGCKYSNNNRNYNKLGKIISNQSSFPDVVGKTCPDVLILYQNL